jgi:hypothetical protein
MSPIAIEHGRKAFLNGWSFTECPMEYAKDESLREAWESGWQKERRKYETDRVGRKESLMGADQS